MFDEINTRQVGKHPYFTILCRTSPFADSCEHPIIEHSNFADEDLSADTVYPGFFVIVECDDGYTSGTGQVINETLYCEDRFYNRTVFCYGKFDLI